jgi:lipoxygenase homology domain-containing protein 1
MQITSDGSGLGASWHLNEVEVTDTIRGAAVAFPCGAWLDPAQPGSLDQTLQPRGVDGAAGGDLLQYEVCGCARA